MRLRLILLTLSLCVPFHLFATKKANTQIPWQELRTFTDVFSKLKTDYVEEVSDKELLEGAIRGMLFSLDPHSNYLDEEEYRALSINTSGEFGGLGIEISGTKTGYIKIIAPIEDTPAEKAGILAGDIIIRIEGISIQNMNTSEAIQKMRGPIGSSISIMIERTVNQQRKRLSFSIKRANIQIKSVKYKYLGEGIGYLRITKFQTHTGKNLHDAIKQLKSKTKQGLSGLIIDLRNNPGGILNAAVAVADTFIKEGRLVYTEGRAKNSKLTYSATPKDHLNGAPIVVLVNQGSASASEIVAGALQDHRRAIILGSRTFGKGSVQTILPLSTKKAVKLTTALYYTPQGRSIQAQGIVPDIFIDHNIKLQQKKRKTMQPISEARLSKHIDNKQKKEYHAENKKIKSFIQDDYALNEAYNLMIGLKILKGKK